MLLQKSCMHVSHCMITLVKALIVLQLDSQTLGDILQQASWGDNYTKYYLHCFIRGFLTLSLEVMCRVWGIGVGLIVRKHTCDWFTYISFINSLINIQYQSGVVWLLASRIMVSH